MWRPKNRRERQTQPPSQAKHRKPAMLLALEPRMVFDGAAVATAHAVHAGNLEQVTHHFSALSSIAFRNTLPVDPQRPIASLLHPVMATVPEAATPAGPAVVFIDSRVQDPQSLLQGVVAGTQVVYLNPNQDGLQQIAGYLAVHHGVGSVEIIAHGADAELQLGSTDLTSANVDSYAQTLRAIGSNLKPGADILVYACDVAADAKGVAFVDTLAALTGHNIAASSNVVGAGGGWDLDVTTGDITAVPVLSRQAEALYGSELVTINTVAELNAAIAADANDSTNDTITITGNITFASTSDTIAVNHSGSGSLTINGGGFTINGNHDNRVITINSGSVTLENVTIENGLVSGAGGGFSSRNGGSATGAGIYVGGSSVVSIKNVTVLANDATGGGGGGSGIGYSYGGGGGSGISGVGGGAGGAYDSGHAGGAPSNGIGGLGGNAGTPAQSGIGGSTTGGAGGMAGGGFVAGGSGATAGTVGGGGGGAGGSAGTNGGSGGLAAGGMYIGGTAKVYMSTSTFSHNYGAGGGGGGGYEGAAGSGGNGSGAITLGAAGTLEYQSSSVNFIGNLGTGGQGGSTYTGSGGGTAGANGTSSGTSGIQNLGIPGHVNSSYNPPPTVTATFISVSGSSGTGGDYRIGDTVTATWNNSGTGDSNSATVTGVTFNFSQFGGGSAVVATDVSNVWTATYTITSGAIDAANRNVAVTATDVGGSTTTTGTNNVTVDNEQPVVTAGNISLSGATGTGGVFKIGNTVTATWNDSGSGDNNTDTINAGGVTMNFSQFGGGSAVTATNSGGVWTATYTITAGAIDTANAHVAVTAADHAGNATTTSGGAVTVDDISPVVTAPNISLSGGSGTGGAFKIGDTVTVTWNDSGTGDNNTDTINAGGVTMNFSQFGGGSAVVATDVANVWAATYTITSGAIDTATAHVAVTATDSVGNATTTSGGAVTVDDIQPVVTAGNISLSGATGMAGAFKTGDTVTATWNDSGTGDNNTDTINAGGVTMNLSQFGGGSAVTATNSGGVWTATYTITAGAIDTANAHVAVTATDHVGNATTTSGAAVTVDDISPVVTAPNISLSGGTGTGGAFKIGDTVTATWNDSGTGDNNTDTINAGGVTMNFSQFGGGSAVVATDVANVWTATYTITSGAIDTATAHVAVTATDSVGNATTTSGGAVTVDDIQPVVTAGNISLSGATGTAGAFKTGDTVIATWNDSGTGDNNTDTINAGGVAMNFSQFGGGSAVTATNSGGVWTATYTITSGSIDTANAHVAVTAIDHVGNATTTSGVAVTVDDIQPVVTAPNISLSGATGTGGAFKIGDTVTATWNDSGTGDNNTDTINAGGVTVDFSQFGGGSAVVATEVANVWTATYTITSGAIDTANAHVAVTATDHVGNATTTSSSAVPVDDIQPIVTSGNTSLSGGTGTGGAFKTGDTVTATWNDSGTGDNNTDTINAGGVTVDFSQFGGGAAVVATEVANVWTATYTITSGAIDTTTAHAAVTATDSVGNATTTSSSAVTVDDIQPIVTSGNISLSGGTGTSGAFKTGDTVTATWNDSGAGDNNTDTINAGGVTMNFSQFGGGSAVVATDAANVWTATYTITSGAIDTANAHVAVTATDHVGNATTTSSSAVTVDDIQPIVTSDNISLSGATGTSGAFKTGDTVTATWNDSGSGDNNTDTINAGGVAMNFSQFGGGSAVTATNSGGVWTATYTITSGAIDTANAHVAVTATDNAGNATTTSSSAVTVDDIQPIVTSDNISLSGATGTGSAFKTGDTVTATWNDSGSGDNNTDTINAGGVTMDFSQFGGGSAVTATNSGGVWTATYTITSGAIDTANAHVAVTATDHVGNATTTSSSAVTVDDIQPIVTSGNISLSGGTGTGGAFKTGDTVTATWNDSGSGDNNTDTINAGGVTMNFSQFGGGSAVTATNSGGVWTATYTITSGAIDTANAHVAVTATDNVGNATTTSSSTVTVDDIQPIVTSDNISLSGATGTGSAFKTGDTVTATWNDSGVGDNNTDTINAGGVTMNFSQFGGGSAVTATNSGGVWTATYTITSGAIDTANAHVAVTATDHVGNATTTSSSAVTVDDIQPIVTSDNIGLSGATGTGGAFKIGDTVTATWNDSGSGDNNTDTINAGGVTMNFSQFGGSSAVTATNSGGVWTATYTITSGAIDTTNAHVAVTATDNVGNATTTSSGAVTVDNTPVTVVSISPSGSTTNTGGSESFTVTFSTAVSGVTASDFTVVTSGVTYSNILNPPTTSDGVHWTVVVQGASGNGTLSVGMTSSGVVADQYGNVVSLPDGGFTVATEPSNDTGYTVHGVPVLTMGSGNSGFTEANPYSGNSPVTIDSGITLTPGNSSTMTEAAISFTGGTYRAGQDVISLGSGSYGNITGSFDSTTGILTLTSAGNTATAAQWQAALNAVSYNDTAASPNTTPRSFDFVVTDSNGLTSTPINETMAVTHTDQSPVVSTSDGSTSYVVNAAATVIDGGIAVTEADGTALSSVAVTVGGGAQSGDVLSFTANAGTMGNIAAGTYNNATHTLTLTSNGSNASLAQWDAALQTVEFATNGNDGNRTISFVATNAGSETSNTAAKTIDVTASSPTLALGAGNVGFTETNPYTANTPATIDSGITLTPGTSSTMTSATVSFAGGTYHSGQDVLSLGNGSYGNITDSFNTTTGALTLTSSGNTATAVQWQAALDAIAYEDTAASPSTTTRSFNFTITDSNGLSTSSISETMVVTHTDQSPVVTTSSGLTDYVSGTSAATVDGSIAISDSDNGTQSSATASITTGFHSGDTLAFNNTSATRYGNIAASYNATTGVLTLNSSGATATLAQWQAALDSIQFSTPTATSLGNRTLSFVVNDGTESSAAATKTVALIAQAFAPPVVENSPGILGSGAQETALVTAHEPSSLTVLQELDSQPISTAITAVPTAVFSNTSLDGGLLGLSDSGSRTQSGVDVPTWLQPTSSGWSAQIPPTLTEQLDLASGETFSITLSSSTPADGDTPYTTAENDVHQADGRPLPAWMHYDAATGVLSGVAPKGGRHEIRLVVTSRDSTGRITHREIVIDFGGRTTSGSHDGSRLPPQSSLSVPNLALHSKPSLAEQFSRQRAALHVSLHPHVHLRRSA